MPNEGDALRQNTTLRPKPPLVVFDRRDFVVLSCLVVSQGDFGEGGEIPTSGTKGQ